MDFPKATIEHVTLDYATPLPPRAPDGGRAAIGWLFVVMLLGGLACGFAALWLGGFGHGWSAASSVAWVAMLASPLSAVAWAMRRRGAGKVLGLLLVETAAVADVCLAVAAESEGIDPFVREWSSERGAMIAWAALWAMWQVVAFVAVLWPRPRWSPDGRVTGGRPRMNFALAALLPLIVAGAVWWVVARRRRRGGTWRALGTLLLCVGALAAWEASLRTSYAVRRVWYDPLQNLYTSSGVMVSYG